MSKNKGMTAKNKATNTLVYTILTVASILWLLPLFFLLLSSFRLEKGSFTNYIIPKAFTLDNYITLFTDTELFNFPRWYANTFVVAVCSCVVSTLFVLMVSYALSRLRFKFRKKYMNIILVLGMFPGFMSMIAIYFILKSIGLTESLLALVLVYSGGAALQYYICKGFFDTIPRSLDEAAMLDGCSKAQIFWKITIPLSKPIIIYTILVTFIAPWVDFIFVSVIMKGNYNNYTVALGLFEMIKKENIYQYYTQFCAGAVLVAVPITILFMTLQRYYVEGITGGSVKG